MANTFKRADASVAITRTLVYTTPVLTTSVIFSGSVSNVDDTNKNDHYVTVEIQKTDNSYLSVYNNIPIPYGSALSFDKIILVAGEKLYAKADVVSTLAIQVNIAEQT